MFQMNQEKKKKNIYVLKKYLTFELKIFAITIKYLDTFDCE